MYVCNGEPKRAPINKSSSPPSHEHTSPRTMLPFLFCMLVWFCCPCTCGCMFLSVITDIHSLACVVSLYGCESLINSERHNPQYIIFSHLVCFLDDAEWCLPTPWYNDWIHSSIATRLSVCFLCSLKGWYHAFSTFPFALDSYMTYVMCLVNLNNLSPSQGEYSCPQRMPLNKCVKQLVCAQTLLP